MPTISEKKSARNSSCNPESLDLGYIRKFIPVEDVWNELADETAIGMEPVRNHHARCPWHDDRTPSLHFAKNNKWKCQACHPGASPYFSNLDLVRKVLSCDLPGALRWFVAHWGIPRAHVGRPEGSRAPQKPYRIGFGGPLEMIVRSGLYSELSAPAARLLPVLVAVQDERGRIDWSYAALMAASGIRSSDSLSKGLKELIRIYAIELRPVARLSGPGHRNLYRLTLDDPRLAAKIDDSYRAHHYANEQARKLAAERRKLRSHASNPEAAIS